MCLKELFEGMVLYQQFPFLFCFFFSLVLTLNQFRARAGFEPDLVAHIQLYCEVRKNS